MLKFNRLKSLTEDIDLIKKALSKSSSGLLQIGDEGIRRNPDRAIPDSFDEAFEACKDRSVYVKGFNPDTALDEIIDWLEKHGGKTGSVFAVFESKEDTEKFLNSEGSSTFGENSTIRMYREEYWEKKKTEQSAKHEARAERNAAAEAARAEQILSRMSPGALLELSGLPDTNKKDSKKTDNRKEDSERPDESAEDSETVATEELKDECEPNEDDSEALTVLNLKKWLVDKIGTDMAIAWVDVDPTEGKAIVRFKQPDTAAKAWEKLTKAFEEKPVVYSNCTLTGRVLSGEFFIL
ncbi:unnamed protein product [Echinostoma caproni]|uniref:HTH La-type RNA-binding domain-containing protein n=1 Tax=Echinostoma caproni TaxID=27848 RepID=A0A183B8D8_9TREM|nr:unnamed protein product [Echinostoma caproni]